MNQKQELSTFEAAKEPQVSIRTVQQWVDKGILTGRKTSGGHRRLDAEEVHMLVARRQHDNSSRRAACKVLIIEDDPDICRLYEIMSRSWRCFTKLHFAHDGIQGLIAMGEFQPDFVVVDLNIPLIDGFQLIKTLSAKFDTHTFRYCVVTGLSTEEIEKLSHLPKGCPILAKPIDFPRLEKLIADAYGEVSMQRNSIEEAVAASRP